MNNNNWLLDENDLVTNPSPRIPICLCLDTSFSMDGEKITSLNNAIDAFYSELSSDMQTAASCEISIVTFNTSAAIYDEFSLVQHKSKSALTCTGSTNMLAGIELALNTLESRKDDYKMNGIDYYQPWLIIMSDGFPNNAEKLKTIQKIVRDLESKRKLMVLPVGIGDDADLETLSLFSNKNPGAFTLKGLKFKEFFTFISRSMESISRSKPSEKVNLPLELIQEWAEL